MYLHRESYVDDLKNAVAKWHEVALNEMRSNPAYSADHARAVSQAEIDEINKKYKPINVSNHTIEPGNITGSGITNSIKPDNHSWENAICIDDNWKSSKRLWYPCKGIFRNRGADLYDFSPTGNIKETIHYGSGQIVKTYSIPEPRASASYMLNDISSLKLGYARNSQYLHLISNPTDKWVGSNNIIKREISDQVSLGYFRSLKNGDYEFSVGSYNKYMQNQIDYEDVADKANYIIFFLTNLK